MFLALALLVLHPQLAFETPSQTESSPNSAPAAMLASNDTLDLENSLPAATTSLDAAAQPASEPTAALPDSPVPVAPLNAPAPMAFISSGKPMKVSVWELRAENRRKQLMWRGLVIASSGAATFDAWSTRHAITTSGAVELNPLLRPFAGNASLYAAIQVGPLLMDYAGKKMMYSKYSWVRHMWWVPQSASFVSSIFCGAHNVAYH